MAPEEAMILPVVAVPLTKWNSIKAELIAMWEVVNSTKRLATVKN